jgi:hypothetical protein
MGGLMREGRNRRHDTDRRSGTQPTLVLGGRGHARRNRELDRSGRRRLKRYDFPVVLIGNFINKKVKIQSRDGRIGHKKS